MLERKPFAGAADPGLALVDDEEDAALLAVGMKLLHPLDGRDVDAAPAHHQLDHDAGRRHAELGDLLAVGEAFAPAAGIGLVEVAAIAIRRRQVADVGDGIAVALLAETGD